MGASIIRPNSFLFARHSILLSDIKISSLPFRSLSRSFPQEEELRRRRWLTEMTLLSSGPYVDNNCAKWCRSPIAPFTKWSSAGNFRGASPSRPAASYGICRRWRPGWLRADQARLSAHNLLTSGNGDRARFESRVGLKQRHRRRDEYRNALLARDPGVDDVRPLLHHMAALHLVLRLVVDSA